MHNNNTCSSTLRENCGYRSFEAILTGRLLPVNIPYVLTSIQSLNERNHNFAAGFYSRFFAVESVTYVFKQMLSDNLPLPLLTIIPVIYSRKGLPL
jgi:hypothetical protein